MEENDDDTDFSEFCDFISAGAKYKEMKAESLKINFDAVQKEVEIDALLKTREAETEKSCLRSKKFCTKDGKIENKDKSEKTKNKEEVEVIETDPVSSRTRRGRKRNSDPTVEETQNKQRNVLDSPIYIPDSPVEILSSPNKPDVNNFIYVSSGEESDHCLDVSVPDDDDENYEVSVKVWWKFVRFDKFNIRRFQKLEYLFEHYTKLEGVKQNQILLTLNDKKIHPSDTPDSLKLTVADILEGGVTSVQDNVNPNPVSKQQEAALSEDELELKVQRKGCKEHLPIRFLKTQKMKIFMLKCAELLELPIEKLKFSFDGETISSNDTPVDLDLEGGECIDLHVLQ
ncbi:hypothetical protein L9F63_022350 [Diploptera punctata]|uniref:Rad60/SUMO-like domain-containing protein n=1 Tax=Diploptera punctata TaxID=6984 RepID=A0AAD7ZMW5_DIPPU|nr:hypothetical protein L9F63_022350 [Diploptera punctata]